MKKCRVLFVEEDLFARGAEKVGIDIMNNINRENFIVELWSLKGQGRLWNELDKDISYSIGIKNEDRIRKSFPRAFASLFKAAHTADVIVAGAELLPSYFAILVGVLTRKPVVMWVHNSMEHVFVRVPGYHKFLTKIAVFFARQIVFPSDGAMNTLMKIFRTNSKKLIRIYNPIDLNNIKSSLDCKLPSWFTNIKDQPIVLGVGRLSEQKGFDVLIKAHALLVKSGIKNRLVILGVGELHESLVNLSKSLGVEQSVFLPGFEDNPYKFMVNADVFALSSRYEGFALVVAEALACGVPVIATDCPSGPSEILAGGLFGQLVPTDNVEELAKGIKDIITSPKTGALAHNPSLDRSKDFSIGTIIAQWELLLIGIGQRSQKERV